MGHIDQTSAANRRRTAETVLNTSPLEAGVVPTATTEELAAIGDAFARLEQEKAALQQRVSDLESENALLRAALSPPQDPPMAAINRNLERILLFLFNQSGRGAALGTIKSAFKDQGDVVEYRLEKLGALGLATCKAGRNFDGLAHWNLTPPGRKYVVEDKLA